MIIITFLACYTILLLKFCELICTKKSVQNRLFYVIISIYKKSKPILNKLKNFFGLIRIEGLLPRKGKEFEYFKARTGYGWVMRKNAS